MQGDVQCYRPIAYSARGENDELKCWNNERGNVFMRCLLVVVFVAILLAAADLIRADSPAEAAGGGYASRCGGGKSGRFHEIGIGACTGDYNDSKTTMYTTDSGAPAEQRSELPQLLRNFKIIVEDIGNSVDTVG